MSPSIKYNSVHVFGLYNTCATLCEFCTYFRATLCYFVRIFVRLCAYANSQSVRKHSRLRTHTLSMLACACVRKKLHKVVQTSTKSHKNIHKVARKYAQSRTKMRENTHKVTRLCAHMRVHSCAHVRVCSTFGLSPFFLQIKS